MILAWLCRFELENKIKGNIMYVKAVLPLITDTFRTIYSKCIKLVSKHIF